MASHPGIQGGKALLSVTPAMWGLWLMHDFSIVISAKTVSLLGHNDGGWSYQPYHFLGPTHSIPVNFFSKAIVYFLLLSFIYQQFITTDLIMHL